MEEKVLLRVGFSKNEARVYVALLELGSSTVGQIAQKSRVYRTNVYDSLTSLSNKGLVNHIYKGKNRYFEAENPTKIETLLDEKKKTFQQILPKLLTMQNMAKSKERAHIYEGMQGIRLILEDELRDKKSIYAFGLPKDTADKMKNFIGSYHKRRIKLKIIQNHIYDENAKERIKYLNSLGYTKAKYMPKEENSPATTTIYGNKVAFFIWTDSPFSVLIESERMAEAYIRYFKILWKLAK